MTYKIRPCPFCGRKPKVQHHVYTGISSHFCDKYSLQCLEEDCPIEGVFTHKELSKEDAVNAWNTRA